MTRVAYRSVADKKRVTHSVVFGIFFGRETVPYALATHVINIYKYFIL